MAGSGASSSEAVAGSDGQGDLFGDVPDLPPPAPRQIATGGPLVIRWLLHRGFSFEAARGHYAPFDRLLDPDPVTRGAIATASADALKSGREVLIIVNNKAEGSAPQGIVALARHIAREADAA